MTDRRNCEVTTIPAGQPTSRCRWLLLLVAVVVVPMMFSSGCATTAAMADYNKATKAQFDTRVPAAFYELIDATIVRVKDGEMTPGPSAGDREREILMARVLGSGGEPHDLAIDIGLGKPIDVPVRFDLRDETLVFRLEREYPGNSAVTSVVVRDNRGQDIRRVRLPPQSSPSRSHSGQAPKLIIRLAFTLALDVVTLPAQIPYFLLGGRVGTPRPNLSGWGSF